MAEIREAEAEVTEMESRAQSCRDRGNVGEPMERGGAKEGRPGLGSPAGRGPAGDGVGWALWAPPPPSPPAPGGGGGRVPSYQVTAGFASFSLARPQPIRAQRRCSRAGAWRRAHLPPTPAQHAADTQSQWLTHTLSQGHAASPPTHATIVAQ